MPKKKPTPSRPNSRMGLSVEGSALLRIEYGKRLREARLAAGHDNLTHAAERANLSRVALTQLESGRASPSMATLDRLITTLGLDPAILFRGPEHRSASEV